MSDESFCLFYTNRVRYFVMISHLLLVILGMLNLEEKEGSIFWALDRFLSTNLHSSHEALAVKYPYLKESAVTHL